ncbi:hypothetical protein BKA57DRAFT_444374 [Linnemannia elongata]|nr:hypothetical protein BKA57DRAFT_444374 [Linnemannia elongata]
MLTHTFSCCCCYGYFYRCFPRFSLPKPSSDPVSTFSLIFTFLSLLTFISSPFLLYPFICSSSAYHSLLAFTFSLSSLHHFSFSFHLPGIPPSVVRLVTYRCKNGGKKKRHLQPSQLLKKLFRNRTGTSQGSAQEQDKGNHSVIVDHFLSLRNNHHGTISWIARGQRTIWDMDKGVESVSDPGTHRVHAAFYFI